MVTDQYRVARFNESAARLLDLNYSRVGQSVRDVFAGHSLSVVLDVVDSVTRTHQPARQTIEHGSHHLVLRGLPRQIRPAETRGCVVSISDESALFEVQRHFRESQSRFTAFMENAAISMAVKDTAGRYEFCNPQFSELMHQLTGSKEEIIGRTDAQILPIEIAQRFRTRDIEVMRRNTAFQENEHLLLADGRHNFMALHFPQLDEQGTLFAVGTLLTDITGYHLLLSDEDI